MEEPAAAHHRPSGSGCKQPPESGGPTLASPTPNSPTYAAYDDCEVFPISLMKTRQWHGPMTVMVSTYLIVQWLGHIMLRHSGNIQESFIHLLSLSPLAVLQEMFVGLQDLQALGFVVGFLLFEGFLLIAVPGGNFDGPRTANGYVPVYRTNGLACHLLTLATWAVLAVTGALPAAFLAEHVQGVLTWCNQVGMVVCGLLYVKGKVCPTGPDSGPSGESPVFDFYWGLELHPRVLGVEVKQWTNCRFGLMLWSVACLSFTAYAYERTGLTVGLLPSLVSLILQLVYCTKFFAWEMGYCCSMDIQHDRAGFYLIWGCIGAVPAMYTSALNFICRQPPETLLTPTGCLVALTVGLASVLCNYAADRQKHHVRHSSATTQAGADTPPRVWGRPAKVLRATYVDRTGQTHTSLLLLCGFWGMARHFHYLFEILAALCWSIPAGSSGILPYLYVIFLTLLLLDRTLRDEQRCHRKYGMHWESYKEKVPWVIIPYVW
eukprot:RCo043284